MHPWGLKERVLIGDFRIFSVFRDVRVHPRRGTPHTFFRLHCPDWVNVVAVTTGGEVILVRQFRAGTEEVTLEIPGGMVDHGETPAAAAARELREETGAVARALVPLGVVHPNPAFQTNRCFTFLAQDVEFVAPPHFDSGEYLSTLLVPVPEIPPLLASGEITHALVVSAFHWYFASLTLASRTSGGAPGGGSVGSPVPAPGVALRGSVVRAEGEPTDDSAAVP